MHQKIFIVCLSYLSMDSKAEIYLSNILERCKKSEDLLKMLPGLLDQKKIAEAIIVLSSVLGGMTANSEETVYILQRLDDAISDLTERKSKTVH